MDHTPPGLLTPETPAEVVMMACTAGHVDHGKTSLVKLLTGCMTDRLKEEIERGMSIELGFAPCFLGGGLCLGIVDVPGHERFVRNMVAGVSGIDMCIMVIAADDGIMPQTVEHFEIMDLLGVHEGVIALTKTDRVPAGQVGQRVTEVREFFSGTFLAGAPICPVSSETLEGYDRFYETLAAKAAALRRKARSGVFRMPVERVFSQTGFGMVVSGIPVAGRVSVGDRVEAVPGGASGRVRGIQCFMRDAVEGGAGQCLALNIPDLDPAPARGQVLCAPDYLKPARFLHVRLRAVSRMDRPLKNAEEIKIHTGTLEANGKVYLIENPTLGARQAGWATVAVEEPVAAAAGDRLILRRPSPPMTVAGGMIVSLTHGPNRPRKADLLAHLNRLGAAVENTPPDTDEWRMGLMECGLDTRESPVASREELMRENLLTTETAAALLETLEKNGKILSLEGGNFISTARYRSIHGAIHERVVEATQSGIVFCLTMADIPAARDIPAPLWRRIAADLAGEGLAEAHGNRLDLTGAAQHLPAADRELMTRTAELYERTGFASPRPDEVAGMLGADPVQVERVFDLLFRKRDLVKVAPAVVLSARHMRLAQNMVVNTIRRKGSLDSADFKQMIGTSRKYAIAILDLMDSRRITIRKDNVRTLSADHEKHLF
jgi:selenocysteine-specific elongation factor